MPKRSSSTSLTGGTGDVNPQVFVVQVSQPAADTTATQGIPLPVPRYPGNSGRAIVMEILKVTFMVGDMAATAGTAQAIVGVLSTRVPNTTSQTTARFDTANIAQFRTDFIFATAAGFQWVELCDIQRDLTDSAGHGLLVGTDNIFLTCISAGTASANVLGCRIEYRLKEVGLAEYIGIVQSQQ